MSEMIIIRGLPGSGKTTMAKQIYSEHVLCEADQFFEVNGVYCYDPAKIREAHKWCQKKAYKELKKGNDVVVANTFVRVWEMKPYLDMGFKVQVMVATGNFKSIHQVPGNVVRRMRDQFEDYSKK